MPQSYSRRRFLGTSLAAGAATLASSVYVSADDPKLRPVTIGVMGLSRGMSLTQTFGGLEGVKVKYVCDVDSARASSAVQRVQERFNYAPEAISDFRRILDDDGVDALVCAAPNHWHAPATIMGLNAGKHVYVEKPCSHNPWEGETMVEAARKAKRAVQMGTQRRSNAQFQEAIKKLHDGAIGRVYLARSWYNNLRGSIGTGKQVDPPENLDYELWQGPAPRKPYMDNVVHYNWHWFWHWGNGELGNNGVHALDICRWGLNTEYPTRVVPSGGRYRWDDDQQTPDTHTVAYEFEGEKQATWEGLSCNRHKDGSGFVSFYGEDGTLAIDGSGNYTVYDLRDNVVEEVKGEMSDADHIGNFIAAIRNETPLALNAEILEGHRSTLMCHLGNIAHRVGRTITCDPKNGHIQGDEEAAGFWKREYAPDWEPKIG